MGERNPDISFRLDGRLYGMEIYPMPDDAAVAEPRRPLDLCAPAMAAPAPVSECRWGGDNGQECPYCNPACHCPRCEGKKAHHEEWGDCQAQVDGDPCGGGADPGTEYCGEHQPVCPPLGHKCLCQIRPDVEPAIHAGGCVCPAGCACDEWARAGIHWVSRREREIARYAYSLGTAYGGVLA